MNLIRGPARMPGWAQLIRAGGDGVAILFGELRKSISRIDGVVERLRYSATEQRWVIEYQARGRELFSVRISPGLLEAYMPLSWSDAAGLLRNHNLSAAVRDAIRSGAVGPGESRVQFILTDRQGVRSFANLARARNRLISNTQGSDE
ncbi:MAG TPA: hypothetical protein VFL79_09890 [Terriglobia bacterium]|nr:hypothetical protein [Terriglobia bacterium]